jgi:hypothetical protein
MMIEDLQTDIFVKSISCVWFWTLSWSVKEVTIISYCGTEFSFLAQILLLNPNNKHQNL